MAGYALGLIETAGLSAAVEAADVALKSADVHLIGYELARGGRITVKLEGEVSAVSAAIRSSYAAASKVSKVYSRHVIPRPHRSLDIIIESEGTKGRKTVEPDTAEPEAGEETYVQAVETGPAPQEALEEDLVAEESEETVSVPGEATTEEESPALKADTEPVPQEALVAHEVEETVSVPDEPDDMTMSDEEQAPEYPQENLQEETKVQPPAIANEEDNAPEPASEAVAVEKIEPAAESTEKPETEAVAEKKPEPVQVKAAIELLKPKGGKIQAEEKGEPAYTCNLCRDPKCKRKKGGPRTACIHYKKSK